MANPNYPNQPPMQQMHPMQQMPPMHHPQGPRPKVVRRGTSRAVPVVVSAGLAVGVFCGLLFGLGTGNEDAIASPSKGNNVKAKDGSDEVPLPLQPTVNKAPPPMKAGSGSAVAAAGSNAGSGSAVAGAGAGSGSAATAGSTPTGPTAAGAGSGSAVAMVKKAKLTVEVTPETVAATAKITVDKQEITGPMEIELGDTGKKEVKVVVKASGYKTVEQKVEVEGDVTVKIELIKRAPSGGGTSTPKRPKNPPGGGGGGLIDI